MLNPKYCKYCSTAIDYEKRKSNIFCNSKCAATYNTAKKDWSIIRTGPKPKLKLSPEICKDSTGPYTKIYLCKCKITGKKWYSPTVKTIHPESVEIRKVYAYQCRFTFSPKSFPEWFDYSSDLISEYGWYSAANRGNNLSGCSRDHMYSISDGFANKINTSIISHPANCQIVPHRKNQNKNKKSIITLDQLMERIYTFNKKYNLEMANGVAPFYTALQAAT